MKKYCICICIVLSSSINGATGQISNSIKTNSESHIIKKHIMALTDTAMHGRGYVKNGKETAAKYIQDKYKEMKLRGITKDGGYAQAYYFPVNTFPGEMQLTINKTELKPGEDFIIDPASTPYQGTKLELKTIDLKQVVDTASWLEMTATFTPDRAYYFDDIEHVCQVLKVKKDVFPYLLPHGCYLINGKEKLTWSVKLDTCKATIFYVKESALPKKLKTIDVNVETSYTDHVKNENIIGFLPGKIKDTFIVFTAHYDHLGMMGNDAIYPGASDNASGTAMLLYLAQYFTTHPQQYSVAFMAFSGEEAELMGSRYYTKHPVIPLKNIKFLTNIDIMGDATDGVTVVNATEYPREFNTLQKLNVKGAYLPIIKSRGKAANSDHYFFTEAGVPSFFLYSNGGNGYYHDVYDKGSELSLKNIEGVARLLIDFTKGIN